MDRSKLIKLGILIVILFYVTIDISAQCPMCRAAASTNLANGGTEGKGLNTGILYMLALPYAIVATLGFLWWKNRKNSTEPFVE